MSKLKFFRAVSTIGKQQYQNMVEKPPAFPFNDHTKV